MVGTCIQEALETPEKLTISWPVKIPIATAISNQK